MIVSIINKKNLAEFIYSIHVNKSDQGNSGGGEGGSAGEKGMVM